MFEVLVLVLEVSVLVLILVLEAYSKLTCCHMPCVHSAAATILFETRLRIVLQSAVAVTLRVNISI